MLTNYKIAIIGYGVVGRAFGEMISGHYNFISYDPEQNNIYPKNEIDSADLAVIAVPTNSKKDGSCDVSIVEEVVKKVESKLILIKSTVEPGTTDRLIKKTNKNICFSPEYIGESKYYHPYWNTMKETPYFIVGGNAKNTRNVIQIFEPILGPTKNYFKCSAVEAEVIKYMENCFFATKVTFVNEFYDICNEVGADWQTVREGWLLDNRINKMHTSVFSENRGFGGKCYPKDLSAIIKLMQKRGVKTELLNAVQQVNLRLRREAYPTKT